MIENLLTCEIPQGKLSPTALKTIEELERRGVDYFEIARLMAQETTYNEVSLQGIGVKDKIFKAVLDYVYAEFCGNSNNPQKAKVSKKDTVPVLAGYIAGQLSIDPAIVLPIVIALIKGIRAISTTVTCELLHERIKKYES